METVCCLSGDIRTRKGLWILFIQIRSFSWSFIELGGVPFFIPIPITGNGSKDKRRWIILQLDFLSFGFLIIGVEL